MLTEVKLMALKSSQGFKLTQITLKCIREHANQPHNSKIAYKNYEEWKNGQNILKYEIYNYDCYSSQNYRCIICTS